MSAVSLVVDDSERQRFDKLTTDKLLAMAKRTCDRCDFDRWTREMLLALFHNRHGLYVPHQDPFP